MCAKSKKKKSVHYINPKEFKQLIIEYYETGVLSVELGEMVVKLSNGVGHAPNFINYSYRSEMIGDAVLKVVTALDKQNFDPEKGNPFSYFSRVAFNAMVNRIKVEKKQRNIVDLYREETYTSALCDQTNGNKTRQPHIPSEYE